MEPEGFGEKERRDLGVTGGSAPYIDTQTNLGEDDTTVELVPGGALLAAESLPLQASPVSVYLAGLAESSRRPMRTNLETIARLVSGGRVAAMDLAW